MAPGFVPPSEASGGGGSMMMGQRQDPSTATATTGATASSGGGVIIPDKEAEIILPPPTPLNPVPALPVALRIDNQEQLFQLLRSDPNVHAGAGATGDVAATITSASSCSFRQLLVFGSESLRTLLMRQVLSDPHNSSSHSSSSKQKGGKKNKNNWDSYLKYPTLPFRAGLNILGTRVLDATSSANTTTTTTTTTTTCSLPASK